LGETLTRLRLQKPFVLAREAHRIKRSQYASAVNPSTEEISFRQEQSPSPMKKNSVSPWKTWEFDLVDWSTLEADGSAVGVPEAVQSLASASSEEEATKAYWRLDGLIVNEHRIFAAAAPTVRCLLAALLHSTAEGHSQILELLGQIGARSLQPDEEWNPDSQSKKSSLAELAFGSTILFDVLEHASDRDLYLAVDLVYIVGLAHQELRRRSCLYLRRASQRTCSDPVTRLITESLAELELQVETHGEGRTPSSS
jgi:hypothetical protein